jgi:hypothetical protein
MEKVILDLFVKFMIDVDENVDAQWLETVWDVNDGFQFDENITKGTEFLSSLLTDIESSSFLKTLLCFVNILFDKNDWRFVWAGIPILTTLDDHLIENGEIGDYVHRVISMMNHA